MEWNWSLKQRIGRQFLLKSKGKDLSMNSNEILSKYRWIYLHLRTRQLLQNVQMDRIQIESLIPDNNRKRNFHQSENESEEDENGLLGRICNKVKSAITK